MDLGSKNPVFPMHLMHQNPRSLFTVDADMEGDVNYMADIMSEKEEKQTDIDFFNSFEDDFDDEDTA